MKSAAVTGVGGEGSGERTPVKVTDSWPLPRVAVPIVGAPGVVAGARHGSDWVRWQRGPHLNAKESMR